LSGTQIDEPQSSGFVRALNSMMDNLENVVVTYQKALLAMLENIEKLESLERPFKGEPAASEEEPDTGEITQPTNDAIASAEIPVRTFTEGVEMKQKFSFLRTKFVLGLVTLVVGLIAANLVLFHWVERIGLYYLLGDSASYLCAYGGFAAMIFGAMLINDFLVLRNILKGKYATNNGTTIFCDVEKEEGKQTVVARGHNNKRRKIAASLLVISLFMFLPVAVSSLVSYTTTAIITPCKVEILDLYVDSFDATKDQWVKNGSSPYLDAQDEPNNYVYSPLEGNGSKNGDQIGDFGFEDASQTGTIISVKLRVYGHASTSNPDQCYFSVHLWNGSSWTEIMDFEGEGNYVWKEVDVSSYLDNWDKVNGAEIFLRTEDAGSLEKGEHACDAAFIRVNYT